MKIKPFETISIIGAGAMGAQIGLQCAVPLVVRRKTLPRATQNHSLEQTPYRDGTTHITLKPLDFIARLAALLPKPGVNLTRFHGVFAPAAAGDPLLDWSFST